MRPEYPAAYPTSDECALPRDCFVRMPSDPPLGGVPPDELARIRRIFHNVISQRVDNPADAEDLVQEAFLTMAAKCPPVAMLRKGLLAWGFAVLRRKVGNYYRRAGKGPVELDLLRSPRAPGPPPPDSTLHHRELRALVRGIVDGFSPDERAVMDLVLDGIPTSEIALELHPERYQNIVNRAHRARKKLFRELAKHGYAPTSTRWARRPSARKIDEKTAGAALSVKENGGS